MSETEPPRVWRGCLGIDPGPVNCAYCHFEWTLEHLDTHSEFRVRNIKFETRNLSVRDGNGEKQKAKIRNIAEDSGYLIWELLEADKELLVTIEENLMPRNKSNHVFSAMVSALGLLARDTYSVMTPNQIAAVYKEQLKRDSYEAGSHYAKKKWALRTVNLFTARNGLPPCSNDHEGDAFLIGLAGLVNGSASELFAAKPRGWRVKVFSIKPLTGFVPACITLLVI